MANTGHVTQVIGSTFDAEFPEDNLPAIYNAVTVEVKEGDTIYFYGRKKWKLVMLLFAEIEKLLL